MSGLQYRVFARMWEAETTAFILNIPRSTDDSIDAFKCLKIFSYDWFSAPFLSCLPQNTVTNCGRGIKERHVFCQDLTDKSFVADSLCKPSTRPSTKDNCHVQCSQDCEVGQWGDWDKNCSNTCGETLKTRERYVIRHPLGLGRACPSLEDKQLCREPPCVSFTWTLGIWSTCKLPAQTRSVCGNGTQTREVVCRPDPARAWICAKQSSKPVESQKCVLACPGIIHVAFVSYFLRGLKYQERSVLVRPSHFVFRI